MNVSYDWENRFSRSNDIILRIYLDKLSKTDDFMRRHVSLYSVLNVREIINNLFASNSLSEYLYFFPHLNVIIQSLALVTTF